MIRAWVHRISILIFLASAAVAAWYFLSVASYERDTEKLWQMAYHMEDTEKKVSRTESRNMENGEGENGFDLSQLTAINPDCVGYISIPDTPLSYPVMQSGKADGLYYLDHDFEGNYHGNGTPFLDIRCDIRKPSDNLIVYAHNTRNTKMFSVLRFYKDQEFFREHPIVRFDHAGGGGDYEIFAVLFGSVNEEENRKLFTYIEKDPDDPKYWEGFLTYITAQRLYDTGIMPEAEDEILMLSTCYRQIEEGRALIFARRKK